jgi:hypothetical protein
VHGMVHELGSQIPDCIGRERTTTTCDIPSNAQGRVSQGEDCGSWDKWPADGKRAASYESRADGASCAAMTAVEVNARLSIGSRVRLD